jgi:hypothetical protein
MIESNNMGRSVVNYVVNTYEYENVIKFGGTNDGIYSTYRVKNEACVHFKKFMEHTDIEFFDDSTLVEMQTFEKTKSPNGKYLYKEGVNKYFLIKTLFNIFIF